MPLVPTRDITTYYRLDGAPDRPVLVLSHALGLDHGLWDPQMADLLPHFQLLRYDLRGHGATSVPAGDTTVAELGRDVLALCDALAIRRFAFCGLSIGGMIGQWLAVHAPERLSAVVLANTAPRVADPAQMEARRLAVIDGGMAAVADAVLARFFSAAASTSNDETGHVSHRPTFVSWARRTLLATNPAGYAACCAAVRDMDQTADLDTIRIPALVISGDRDQSMPWDTHGAVLAGRLAHAQVVRLRTAHLSNLEAPRAFLGALFDLLLPPPADRLQAGFVARRAALGESYVDRAIASTTAFTREFQELVTTMAWGTIWTRPGLDFRTRRLLVLAITAATGRWEEYRLHLRAALDHGLEPCDIKEVLLHVAVYAGLPAANTGFHIAREMMPLEG